MAFPEFTYAEWTLAFFGSFMVGMHKSGIKGLGTFVVVLLVLVFGGRPSTGILLPLLILGDIVAVIYYHRHAGWKYLFQLLPWMGLGVILGAWFGHKLSDDLFSKTMAVIILLSVLLMFGWDRRKSTSLPNHWSFSTGMGLAAGFTTMVGNLAGSIADLYFLAMRSPKYNFIGTTAWLFLFINLFKVPFHVLGWETITIRTLWLDLLLAPAVFLGLILGIRLVKVFSESYFRRFTLIMTAIGAVLILFR